MDNIEVLQESVNRLEAKMDKNNDILMEHQRRSAANEARIEIMENFLTKSMETSQKNFELMLQSNKENQAALSKQLKIVLGLFSAIATLVGAFAAFFK